MEKYKKSKGNAGLDGVQFQVGLSTVFLLNALRNSTGWKISTENEQAGKYDDIVLELSDGSAVLLQAKHKDSRRITRDQLLSDNSKNADFSLPKYFFSYEEVKATFPVKTVVICTNTEVNLDKLKDISSLQSADPENILYYEGRNCCFIKFNENILPVLKANAELYYDKNLQGKGIDKAVISEENLKDFLGKLQFFTCYPSGENLNNIIDQQLIRLKHSSLLWEISSQEIYKKVEDWFKQSHGEYLTEHRAKAMFCEIRSDKYCKTLKDYDVYFEDNNFSVADSKRIYQISTDNGHLLQALKIYRTLRNQGKKFLFYSPSDGGEVLKETIEAFSLPRYAFLVITCSRITEESLVKEMSIKLKETLDKFRNKKIVLISGKDIAQEIGGEPEILNVTGAITFNDLTQETQERLLRKDNVTFQGEPVCLKELVGSEDYVKAIDSSTLEKLVNGETIKVGTRPLGLDKETERYYIHRTFEKAVPDEGRGGIKKGECFTETTILDVKEKVVMISDRAGMGKSTVLAKLAVNVKERNPLKWVIRIELNNYTGVLRDSLRKKKKDIDLTELLGYKKSTRLSNHLERFIFSMEKKVLVLLDGIDEVSPDYTTLILSLLDQCQELPNFEKVVVTTRPHMNRELQTTLKVKPLILQPFTEQNQITFLTSYWTHNLNLGSTDNERCWKYSKVLINKMSSWISSGSNFAEVPLQIKMLAEIFQESDKRNEKWKGCKEFLDGDEAEPNLPDKLKLTNLYEAFVEKKLNIFTDKANPSGTAAANRFFTLHLNAYFVNHQSLALKDILDSANVSEKVNELFPAYPYDKDMETNMISIGIVQRSNEKLEFVHRTFAEYFVAKSILDTSGLQSLVFNADVSFQTFFVDEILCHPEFNVIRAFLESYLEEIVEHLPPNMLENYQRFSSSDFSSWSYRSTLLHRLADEGCVSILRLVLKCINYKIKLRRPLRSRILNAFRLSRTKPIGNTFNVLQGLVEKNGINFRDETGSTPLHHAAETGRLEMVRFLIEQKANVNSLNKGAQTSLHLAAWKGHLQIVKCLLDKGVDIHIRSAEGFSALDMAALNGQLDTVKCLMQYGADVNIGNTDSYSALHLAAQEGHLKVVKCLVDHGLDVNVRNKEGTTPIHLATQDGHLDTVRFLAERGDVNAKNNAGITPLMLASVAGYVDIVDFLLKAGADINIEDNEGNTTLYSASYNGHLDAVKVLVERGGYNLLSKDGGNAVYAATQEGYLDVVKYFFECCGDAGISTDTPMLLRVAVYNDHVDIVKFLMECVTRDSSSAKSSGNKSPMNLHLAAQMGHLDTVKLLIDNGIDINIEDDEGFTALQLAVQENRLEVVKLLLQCGVNTAAADSDGYTALHSAASNNQLEIVKNLIKHGEINVRSNKGLTPLYMAASMGHLDTVRLLVVSGADASIADEEGFTPMHVAAQEGYLDVVRYFSEGILDVALGDNDGFTAFHLAAQDGHLDIVEYLLQCGFDLNTIDRNGFTALHSAVYNGHLDVARLLVERGIDVNIKDASGATALHSAARNGSFDCVKFLVGCGVDLQVRDKEGCTALHLAANKGNLETVKFLLEEGVDVNGDDDDIIKFLVRQEGGTKGSCTQCFNLNCLK